MPRVRSGTSTRAQLRNRQQNAYDLRSIDRRTIGIQHVVPLRASSVADRGAGPRGGSRLVRLRPKSRCAAEVTPWHAIGLGTHRAPGPPVLKSDEFMLRQYGFPFAPANASGPTAAKGRIRGTGGG